MESCSKAIKSLKSVGFPLLLIVKLITSNDRSVFKDNTSLGSKTKMLYKQPENSIFNFLTTANAGRDAYMLSVLQSKTNTIA